eukprot:CAMPEP_0184680662 /NCGR_PEP_ID=MMETSP0312-20130426/3560_1 /TAXON_ID=31354 /ORGANISM="Compsopogon coeruleus, Strain SAG 36.94" /LENGTH=145 /DNA_ID=CAMNT_0027130935 /DNA_START=207 /DNA_END=644 /DNA_ORIENTATION=+
MSFAMRERVWLKTLTEFLDTGSEKIDGIFDSQGAISLIEQDVDSERNKHVDAQYRIIDDLFRRGCLNRTSVNTQDNVAELLTDAVSGLMMRKLRPRMMKDLEKKSSDMMNFDRTTNPEEEGPRVTMCLSVSDCRVFSLSVQQYQK